jgi:organic hydroperoxide reductase OsmC/OhrA
MSEHSPHSACRRASETELARRLAFQVTANRTEAHGSVARCTDADLAPDTDLAGRMDAFHPATLLLAALAACMIKSIERVAPILQFP